MMVKKQRTARRLNFVSTVHFDHRPPPRQVHNRSFYFDGVTGASAWDAPPPGEPLFASGAAAAAALVAASPSASGEGGAAEGDDDGWLDCGDASRAAASPAALQVHHAWARGGVCVVFRRAPDGSRTPRRGQLSTLTATASRHAAQRAYRRVARDVHPDKPGGDAARFEGATETRDYLRSPLRFLTYRALHRRAPPGDGGGGGDADGDDAAPPLRPFGAAAPSLARDGGGLEGGAPPPLEVLAVRASVAEQRGDAASGGGDGGGWPYVTLEVRLVLVIVSHVK